MTAVLRAGTLGDVPALATILEGWINATAWMPKLHSTADHLAFVSRLVSAGGVRVAELNGTPVGFLSRDGAEVAALYLDPDARGRGIGGLLVRDAQLQSAALNLWTFVANLGAQRFYARHGFVEVGRGDGSGNAEGLPDVRLSWRRPL